MASTSTYLNFSRNTEEAFNFYKSVFGGDFVGGINRFSQVPPQAPPDTKRPVTNKIILIHGLSGESSGWISMKNMLAEHGCELILFDLPGHGESQQELSDVSWKDWARQVQEEVDKQSQDGKVSIFGHSMGGLLAYIVGNQNVDKVENIVTFGAAFQNISLKDKIIIHLSPILK